MEKLLYNDLLDFLARELNETDYFECDKTSLISLRDYLLELKQRKENYDRLISEPLKSIQNKNQWVKNIRPDHSCDENGLVVWGNMEPTLLLGIDSVYPKDNPEDYVIVGGYYVTPFLQQKMKNRKKILENSQEELHEINKIVHQLNVVEKPFETVSGRFEINPSCYDMCVIESSYGPIIKYYRDTDKLVSLKSKTSNDTIYKNDVIKPKKLSLKERENLVKKLYIKR